MSEWQSVTLGQISTQRKGINYKSEDYGDKHSGHPFLTIKCFVKGGGYEPSGIKFYDGFSTKPDHLRAGDILFSVTDLTRAGDIVGSPLKVPDFGGNKPALASMDCMRIEPIIGKCNKDFLFHRLMHPDVRRRMVAYSAGSTVLHLDTKKVPTITVRIPINTREQERIATILTGIDTTIEKTEALIAKYQQIKAGLMHDLFTRGVTADGKLRPPREQAPELYQETPIGWMPKEWEPINLGKYIEFNLYGPRFDAGDYDENGNIKTIRGTDFSKDGEIKYSQVPIARLPNQKMYRHILKAGDLVVVTTADCGLTAVFEEQDFPFIPSAYAVKYRFANSVNPYFIKYFMQTNLAKRQVNKYVRQGTLGNLPGSDLLRFFLALPRLSEQAAIVKRLETMQKKITLEQQAVDKLAQQKLGLMHDLLTGKIAVNPRSENQEVLT